MVLRPFDKAKRLENPKISLRSAMTLYIKEKFFASKHPLNYQLKKKHNNKTHFANFNIYSGVQSLSSSVEVKLVSFNCKISVINTSFTC